MKIELEDVEFSNADEVASFLDEHADRRFEVGETFVLPDIGQEYTVVAARPFTLGGRFHLYLDLEAQCAVPDCGQVLSCAVDVRLWRNKTSLPRCCPTHRYGFRSPMDGAWKTLEQRLEIMEERDRKAARNAQKEQAKQRLRKEARRGPAQRAVLAAKADLELVSDAPGAEAVVRLAASKLPRPASKRDTRRQQVVRAYRALSEQGLL